LEEGLKGDREGWEGGREKTWRNAESTTNQTTLKVVFKNRG